MPNTRHRKKTLKKSLAANAANRAQRGTMRTAIKRARQSIATEGADSSADLVAASKQIDKAAKKRLVHPNKASRIKSRLAKAANRMSG